MHNPTSDEERTALLNEWVQRLFLDRWRIDAYLNAVPSELKLEGCCGESIYTPVIRAATIHIVRPEAVSDKDYDWEQTLVHELLHLVFSAFYPDDNSALELVIHQTIDDMAKALVNAKRNGGDSQRLS